MPTYEYICKKCGREFEAIHSIAAEPLKNCPKDVCGQKRWGRGMVSRKISAGSGLIFKGSGFYITDYRSEGYKSAAKKDSSDSKPAAKPETKPETKPAKKADKK